MPDSRLKMPVALNALFQFQDGLFTIDGVILYKDRIAIPQSMRAEVLDALHAAQQGVTSMITRTESSAFLPGINHSSNYRCSC